MKLDPRDIPAITEDLDRLASSKGYTKIFAKVPEDISYVFLDKNYVQEARIPSFFEGKKTGLFLAKYFSEARKQITDEREITKIINLSIKKNVDKGMLPIHCHYPIQKVMPQDVEALSALYKTVFPSYPFPIDDPEYLRKTMASHIEYYLIRDAGKIVAAASSEMDPEAQHVEMTDFATLPEYRGKNLSGCLLRYMEKEMRERGMRLSYTIARALSYGMNMTFAKNDYVFAGTLVNNTQISGQIESMNVWYKALA